MLVAPPAGAEYLPNTVELRCLENASEASAAPFSEGDNENPTASSVVFRNECRNAAALALSSPQRTHSVSSLGAAMFAPPDDLSRHLLALFLFGVGIGAEWYYADAALSTPEPFAEHHNLSARQLVARLFGALLVWYMLKCLYWLRAYGDENESGVSRVVF